MLTPFNKLPYIKPIHRLLATRIYSVTFMERTMVVNRLLLRFKAPVSKDKLDVSNRIQHVNLM